LTATRITQTLTPVTDHLCLRQPHNTGKASVRLGVPAAVLSEPQRRRAKTNFVLSGKLNFTPFQAISANPKVAKIPQKISHFCDF
jgi:hypothetical protein